MADGVADGHADGNTDGVADGVGVCVGVCVDARKGGAVLYATGLDRARTAMRPQPARGNARSYGARHLDDTVLYPVLSRFTPHASVKPLLNSRGDARRDCPCCSLAFGVPGVRQSAV